MRSTARACAQVTFAAALIFAVIAAPFARLSAEPANANLSAPPAPDARSPFGLAGAMRWPDWGTFGRPADTLLDAGAAWAREDFNWSLIEPREGQYNFTATDRIAGALATRGVNLLGIISYSVNWATPTKEDDASGPLSFYSPDLGKYFTFVHDLVTRYKTTVHYWEIWNEPNNAIFWKPAPNAREYAALLKTAYRAIKFADPNAQVVTAGMSGNSVPFLEEMIAAGAGDSFDILAIHPYAVPLNPQNARVESRPEVHKLVEVELYKYRAFLQRHSYNRPLWITEIGWPAGDWQLDPQLQADYLAQAYAQSLASGLVDRIFWYAAKDEDATPQKSWGLTAWGTGKTDLAPRRPAFAAYATSSRLLTGATPRGRIRVGKVTVVSDFEAPATWTRTANPNGDLSVASGAHHSGSGSGKLQYKLDAPSQAVDFAPPQTIALPGKPTELGVWVLGNASGDYLNAWLRDRDGELFLLRLGSVRGSADDWQYYGARINGYYFDWEHTGGSPANGKPDYPLSFVAFRLENTPDEPPGSGTIYVDDLQVTEGPDVSAVRFSRPDGQVVDVVWSVDPATAGIPTKSKQAHIIDRDGADRTIDAANGQLTVQVSSRPTYLVHSPEGQTSQYAGAMPAEVSRGPLACAAMRPSDVRADTANLYFPETQHNLHGAFRAYWEAHGGLRVLGYPITEEFTDVSTDGKPYLQQYFQRARMEYHPENQPPNDVLLGLLGRWTTSGRTFAPVASKGGTLFFDQTKHNVNIFRDWWQTQSGLSVAGLPISEEMQEVNGADGKTYTVQYFERNRLEYHPENKGTTNEVLLGLLGVEFLKQQGCK